MRTIRIKRKRIPGLPGDSFTDELSKAKRQIVSTLHKLRETVKTLQGKEHPEQYKSQLTLEKRRIMALEISLALIEKKLEQLQE